MLEAEQWKIDLEIAWELFKVKIEYSELEESLFKAGYVTRVKHEFLKECQNKVDKKT